MQYQISAQFLADVVAIAKEIAFHQRGERKLQSIDDLSDKFDREIIELKEAKSDDEILGELADVVYYGICLVAQGQFMPFLNRIELAILPEYPYSQEQIEAITLAKYRIRAEGPNSKDFERERQAIQAAIR